MGALQEHWLASSWGVEGPKSRGQQQSSPVQAWGTHPQAGGPLYVGTAPLAGGRRLI